MHGSPKIARLPRQFTLPQTRKQPSSACHVFQRRTVLIRKRFACMHGSSQSTNKFSKRRMEINSAWFVVHMHRGGSMQIPRIGGCRRPGRAKVVSWQKSGMHSCVKSARKKQRASIRRPTEGQAYPAHAINFTVPCKHATCKRANMQ